MSATLVAHSHRPYAADLRATIFRVRVRCSSLFNWAIWPGLAGRSRSHTPTQRDTSSPRLASVRQRCRRRRRARADALSRPAGHDPVARSRAARRPKSDAPSSAISAGPTAPPAGRAAPLVPFADYVLFRHPTKTRVLLNLGGIANITYLRAGGTHRVRLSRSTPGPGNCVSDALVRSVDPDGRGLDAGGAAAGRGKSIPAIVESVLADAYFAKPPPKSTDVPAMIATLRHVARVSRQ